MKDLIINTIAGLLSASFIGLWSMCIVIPFRTQQKIRKDVLRLLRNYTDPRKYQQTLVPTSIMLDSIEKQCDQILEISDLIDEQRELHKFTCWFFNYDRLEANLHFLFEYIRNPIMLKEQKEFENSYALDTQRFFADVKKNVKLPKYKLVIIFFVLFFLPLAIIFLCAYLWVK